MTNLSTTNPFGLHYYQDTLHYSSQDLAIWLPELTRLNAGWVVLQSEANRAIPETFITGLIEAGINPIIQFKLPLPDSPVAADLRPILSSYSRWGVKYVVFFDKPNESASWSSAGWSHQDLVERFIDRFLPLAIEAEQNDLVPVFPPLMPGGSYWDTSFFKSSLQSLQRRGQQSLLENMGVGAYAFTFGHELDWGEGGPEKWTQARPYLTPAGSQDQRGFNNFLWLKSIAASAGLKNMPVFQFSAGIKQPGIFHSSDEHAVVVQSILNKVKQYETSSAVAACCFWLLAAEPESEEYSQAWIKSDTDMLPIVRILSSESKRPRISTPTTAQEPVSFSARHVSDAKTETVTQSHPIKHYLLLPVYEWGISDWHLEVAQSFIKKYQPTIGFSLQEAALAAKVTVIGGEKEFSSEEIESLRSSGCEIEQISGDGTSIATKLIER